MNYRQLIIAICILVLLPSWAGAWVGMPTPRLRVEGRYLKDPHGNIVNLYGFSQTYSPWFNERGIRWNNFNVAGCLAYNKEMIDRIMAAGWKMNTIRLHMDPYWSNRPNCTPAGHELPNCFDETRFRKYLDEVFIPMAEYAISKGLYVVLRPPGVAPRVIGLQDDFNYAQYLMRVWDIVSSHPRIRDREEIMIKLANEPVEIRLPDGSVGNNTQAHFDLLKEIFQPIVNRIRENGFHNVIWIPGTGWQSQYRGFAVNPIEGGNIGYAVHVYPGWFGSADGYEVFRRQWDENVGPVAEFAPILVTEVDWAPAHYPEDVSWGIGVTGTAGGAGFGANFRKIVDDSGNAGWIIFTDPHRLAQFTGIPPAPGEPFTFLNDPEACVWPTFHWFQEYAVYNFPRPHFQARSQSDLGNGNFINPVIHADFPNPDVIRVGDIFYKASATHHIFPGATLIKSRDLVNWEYYSNPLQMIEASDAYNLLNGLNRYGKGQWNASLRFHDGTFYIMFSTPGDGAFVLTATDPGGRWELKKLQGNYQYPSLLFDNGRVYVAHGINTLKITELNESLVAIGTDVIVAERPGLRSSRVYKVNGQYYVIAAHHGSSRSIVGFRSNNLNGPFEETLILGNDSISHATLVQTQTGEWWAILSVDAGAFGQLPNLQPVEWVNGWPRIGINNQLVTTHRNPSVGRDHPVKSLPTNDNFRGYRLGSQWGWNHNPDNSRWSLFHRPGWLRLHTSGVASNLPEARNTLTQRIFGFHGNDVDSYATIRVNISNMAEGDVAGLALLQDPYAYIGVTRQAGANRLIVKQAEVSQLGPAITDSIIYLRVTANFGTSRANFYYSLDNLAYTPFGSTFNMGASDAFVSGNRFSIFNYATLAPGGFVDVDWFSTERLFTEDMFFDPRFAGYSETQLAIESLSMGSTEIRTLIGTNIPFTLNARFMDGRVENVARYVTVHNSDPAVARVINGRVLSLKDGTTTITAVYEDRLGNRGSISFNIKVSTFPLISGVFNPSIFASGTFNEATGELVTGQWGFGGWWFQDGVNLSNYRYLVVRLKQPTLSNASFRIFDEPNYWSTPFMVEVRNNTQLVIQLDNMFKTVSGQSVKVNPEKIYIVGFWSHGGRPILIDEVFLSNSDAFSPGGPSGVEDIPRDDTDANDIVDVYSMLGVRLKTGVKRVEATLGLPAGVYIIGNHEKGFQRVLTRGN